MSVSFILKLLNELNKNIICEPLASMILKKNIQEFNKFSNKLTVHKFNILFITY
jgi:hypothetical protein